jgi:glycosyl transferase family 25
MIECLEDIKHAFYINLSHRTDRKIHVENQLNTIHITAERFNAIKMDNGAIGCSMSHLKILTHAKNNNFSHILILEDDITFLNPELFITNFNNFIKTHSNDWDVILFAGNNIPPYDVIDDNCIKVKKCQTTTGYLVNGHYIETLIDNFKDGLTKLIHNPELHTLYAIDKYWFQLQEKDRWFLIIPPTVIQKEDYSDIEKKQTNYKNIMLDIDKPYLSNTFNSYNLARQQYMDIINKNIQRNIQTNKKNINKNNNQNLVSTNKNTNIQSIQNTFNTIIGNNYNRVQSLSSVKSSK